MPETLDAPTPGRIPPESSLSERLDEFQGWKHKRVQLLERLQPWLKLQGLYTDEAHRSIEAALKALQGNEVTVAVAGEFSRGKTELINALFFADHGQRLLPADAGRTTMCPTEVYCDLDMPPQLRLLPIETRRDERSIATLREDDAKWTCFELDPNDPEGLADRLTMLTDRKQVSRHEAAQMGLLSSQDDTEGDRVDIPRWRLAAINIHHPLLARGLRILDTPGLNAIGNEPELTYEMLPAAHAVLFVLAADVGVTRSDMQIWQRFINRQGRASRRGLMVVLNKTDMLWDELRSTKQVIQRIVRQCSEVAQALDVRTEQIFATSAQKALLARIRGDESLEQRSGIVSLERYLGDAVVSGRVDLICQEHTLMVRQALSVIETLIHGRLDRNEQQTSNLAALAGQNDSAITRALETTQRNHERYQASVDAYRAILGTIEQHNREMLSALDTATIDQTIEKIRVSMTGAWTTFGLKAAMRTLFEDIDARIDVVTTHTQAMRQLIRTVYRRFQNQHRLRLPAPRMFSIIRHQVELSLLEQEAEVFRNSARAALMEQHFVTNHYFRTIVSRAQGILRRAHDEASNWSDGVMLPLATGIGEYRDNLAQQIDDLREASESRKAMQRRIEVLTGERTRLNAQLNTLTRLQQTLDDPQAPLVLGGETG